MNTVLMVAVVVIALAVLAQAGALVAMYLMSRRLTVKAEALMDDSRKLMPPLEAITSNLKTVSEDLTASGKIAREQALQVEQMVRETQTQVRAQVAEVRARVNETVDEARTIVMRPVRHYSAIAMGIAVGLRTFFFGRKAEPSKDLPMLADQDQQFPAA